MVVLHSVRCSRQKDLISLQSTILHLLTFAYLLKYDSSQGRYALADKVENRDHSIIVDGHEIEIYKEETYNLPWGKLDIDVVLECTGFYTSKDKAQAHINAGAKKVVISAPAE